ncbi:AAA family ATPase [Chitinophaga cymbidii]|uniref:Shikimate kinase n=1 Tax=Chitinophaga cymbidii TaxID=1096750 RepID=A0A512RGI0_9BACT|nr:AAA family ATPase [Chitinophaga cymbidii]GEP94764.1 hypothetical protein CCY01nite_10240 [Chitinophaga cymbidii]
MKRILITGMSGTGKSTVIGELAARGYKAVDLDSDEFSEWMAITDPDPDDFPVEPDRDWVWREDRVQELLSAEDTDILFVSGTAQNMGKFLPLFDHVILLSAPPAIITERLATRTNNPYGKDPQEMARVLILIDTIEPLLRKIATHEVDTSVHINEVVAGILGLCLKG